MTALLRHDYEKKFLQNKPYYSEKQGNFSRHSFSEYRPEIPEIRYLRFYLSSYAIPMKT